MGILSRLRAIVPDYRGISAGRAQPTSRRPRPDDAERVPGEASAGRSDIAGRVWFLPYYEHNATGDTPDIRAAMRLMLRDPYVKTGWLTQLLTVSSQDFQIHPDRDAKKDPAAQDQANFVRYCFEQCEGEMVGIANAILMNLGSDGYSLCEKVWQVFPRGKYAGKLGLRALKPKDPNRLTLVGDAFRNITAIKVTHTDETFPITDFTYARYLHCFDEPAGMAAFRAGYGSYWMRDTVRKLRAIHLEKKSAGMLKGTYTDPADKSTLESALQKAKSSTWIAVPEGVQLEAISLSTASEPDYKSFDESLREETLVGIALAHLHILQGGVSDARGDTKVHKAVADLGPWLLTYIVQYILNRQVIPDLIDFNFPAAGLDYPRITLGGVTNQESLELLQVLQGAQQAGFKPSKDYYASALTIQEADPSDPDDSLTPPPPGGGMPMGGMPGPPPGGDPLGLGGMPPPGGGPDAGGGDPFRLGQNPFSDPAAVPFSEQPPDFEGLDLFAEEADWVAAVKKNGVALFSWMKGQRGGRYWLPKGKQDVASNRLYGKAAERAAAAAASAGQAPPPAAVPAPVPVVAPTQEPVRTAQLTLADAVAARLEAGQPITAQQLWLAANRAFGGTRAEGKFGPSEAYDALEAGFHRSLAGKTDPTADLADAQQQATDVAKLVASLPTQTNRSGNKDAFQQFSTPPHYAFAAAWLANLSPSDVVLEPTAGTASLAVQMKNTGATVYANELDPKRAALLADILGSDKVSSENAEQIAGILPGKGVPAPTAVVMNPPFSQTAGRLGDKRELLTGAKHISEALTMLAPGGRLVAIVGEGMAPNKPTYRKWFEQVAGEYHLRANVAVSGEEYTKYGTSFGTRILIIDKVPPSGNPPTVGEAKNITDLMGVLADVRNDRPEVVGVASGQSTGGSSAAGAGGGTGAGSLAATGSDVGAGPSASVGIGGQDHGVGAANAGVGVQSPGGELRGTGSGMGADGEPVGAAVGAPRPARGKPPTTDAGRSGTAARGKSAGQSAATVPLLRPAQRVTLTQAAESQGGGGELTESLFEPYTPRAHVVGAKRHPSPLVESAAMASVQAPPATYRPMLSPDVIEQGRLSDAALESVIYAGQSHQRYLPADVSKDGKELPPARRGYFIGDGTGAGKGRQIAGVMTDNFHQGRKKAVWVSLKAPLLEDARRDWGDLGNDPNQVIPFDKLRAAAEPPQEGVAFITYDTLKSAPKDKTKGTNLESLVKWLGPDFDGVIAFDEAHAMANGVASEGARGLTKPSERALSGIALQRMLPNARVLYVSATGATEVENLAYADRLGLWGRGTPFANKNEFISEMKSGGVAAMEAVAQSLKATGSYNARSLSFDDGTPTGKVTYSRLTHSLTSDQVQMYDAAAEGWQEVYKNIDAALEVTGGRTDGRAKSAALSQFWGSQQRFFNQLMTSMQTPSVINAMEQDIAEGRSPVVQLVNTNEAATDRALAKREPEDDVGMIDVSPKEVLMQYLERSFPVHRYEKYLDEDGNERSRLVKDRSDRPVEDPRAVAMRDNLLNKLGMLKIPEGPLDQIVNHFGAEKVAEATGRSQRIVTKMQPNGQLAKVVEPRTPNVANLAEATAFQSGKKRIMVFSDAGGTGRSYHADKSAQNQEQRVHYMLQPGWRADNAVQGLGRTHRTNQAVAPSYRLVEIEQLKGQKRFISTIARRLDQLGALTKGQRNTGSAGLFQASDNLESHEAKKALEVFFYDLENHKIPGLDYQDTIQQLGLEKRDQDGTLKRIDTPPLPQFLNRLLSLKVERQATVFDAFDQRLQQTVEQAIQAGTLDQGMENFQADQVTNPIERPVFRDADTGAEAKLLTTTVTRKSDKLPFDRTKQGDLPIGYVRNARSGRVRAVYQWAPRTDRKTGNVYEQYRLRGPVGDTYADASELTRYSTTFEKLDEATAKQLWETEFHEAPDFQESEEHFLTGAFLPVWDKIPKEGQAKIFRVKPEGGRSVVGRHIPAKLVPNLLKNLGQSYEAKTHTPEDVYGKLSRGSASATLANGWKLKPVRVQGERRIEIDGVGFSNMAQLLADGVIQERINYHTRFFVPTGTNGVEVLRKITSGRNIVDVEDLTSNHSERHGCHAGFDAFAEADGELALAGKDGQRAANLLAAAKRSGREVFARVTEQAVRRMLADSDPLTVPVLFNDDELKEIASTLSATTATADLLGRTRVHRIAERAQLGAFAEAEDDPFLGFAEPPPAIEPKEAVGYFKKLVPTLGVIPERYGPRLDRHAFTLAVASDEAILNRVKDAIAAKIATGQGRAATDVQDILDAAGVSPSNPQYADLVVRTNMNDAYVQGQQAELDSHDRKAAFPAWQYHAVRDGRERATHGARDGKLYPAAMAFTSVRGTAPGDVINCRCGFSPITKRQLHDRLARGETLESEEQSREPE